MKLTTTGSPRQATRNAARAAFVPAPALTLSEWADRYRVLPQHGAAEPGRWRTDRAPFQREIMDAMGDPNVERLVFVKPAQCGATEIMCNAVGYFAHQRPSPMLYVLPTEGMLKAFSAGRLDPMFRDSGALRGLITRSNRRGSNDTLTAKMFTSGAYWAGAWSNSAAQLRMRPVARLFLDEVSAYPESAGDEGDPVTLAEARTTTFHYRTIVYASTPTLVGDRLHALWEVCDQRHYYVPCPECGHMQVLVWANLKYEGLETPMYACQGCGVLIPENRKGPMLRAGEWRPHAESRIRGYRINGLYSPWLRWADIVQRWRESQASAAQLQGFINTVLGEWWEGAGGFNPSALEARRESYPAPIPAGVCLLTAGVDVQADRLECTVLGWGAGEECWRIAHHVIWGDPTTPTPWDALDGVLMMPVAHEQGGSMTVAACGVDTGYATSHVYAYCAPRLGRRVFALKGLSTPEAPILSRKPSRPDKTTGSRLFPVGTNAAKDAVYGKLKVAQPGPGFVHFDMGADLPYFEQLTSERRVRKLSAGQWSNKYEVLPNRRNEALDCFVYALAALHLLGPLRSTLGKQLVNHRDTAAPIPVVAEVQLVPERLSVPPPPDRVVKPKPFIQPRRGFGRF